MGQERDLCPWEEKKEPREGIWGGKGAAGDTLGDFFGVFGAPVRGKDPCRGFKQIRKKG